MSLFFNSQGQSTTAVRDQWMIAVLLVSIGICIDLSKFIFWCVTRSQFYRGISLFLMAFSWLASLSYFVITESESMDRVQRLSPEYLEMTRRMEAINNKLLVNEKLLEKRLSSQYHKQWTLAEGIARENENLSQFFASLEAEREKVGHGYAKNHVPVSRFFVELGKWLGTSEVNKRIISF